MTGKQILRFFLFFLFLAAANAWGQDNTAATSPEPAQSIEAQASLPAEPTPAAESTLNASPSEPARQTEAQAPLDTEPALAMEPAPDAEPALPEEPAVIRVFAVGDIMIGTTFPENILPPNDGADYFDPVQPFLNGSDILFGNLEGPLTEGGKSTKCGDYKPGPGIKRCFAFRSPPRYAKLLQKAGFNALNVANNHAFDFGEKGMENTLAALNNVGIQPVGGKQVAFFHVHDKRIAVVGFSCSTRLTPYMYSMLDIPQAIRIVSSLKAENDLVIVSFHGGAEGSAALIVRDAYEEFLGENRGNPVRFARAVIDAGADLVLGHGPHVPRAIEIYRDKLIAYSLGNFAAYSMFNLTGPSGMGYVLQATLSAETGNILSFRTPSTVLLRPGIPAIDNKGNAETLLRKLSMEFIAGKPDVKTKRETLIKTWEQSDAP